LREQREFFKEEIKRNRELLQRSAIELIVTEIAEFEREIPGLLPQFDIRAAARPITNDIRYRADVVIPYLNSALARLESELEEGSPPPVIQARSFSFLADSGLRSIVERDYREIQRAYIAECWKAVIILSGALIEAVLLDALSRQSSEALAKAAPKVKGDPAQWGLSILIDVAIELHLIGSSASKLSHSIREYRNLVHPGNELRSQLPVAQEEARIAIEVLHIIYRDQSS